MKRCANCNKEYDDSRIFCPECGGALASVASLGMDNAANANAAEKKKRTVPIVIASVAAVIAIIGIFASKGSQSSKGAQTSAGISSYTEHSEMNDNDNSLSESNDSNVDDAAQASVDELLGYVDQAEEIVLNVLQSYADTEEKQTAEWVREDADNIEDAISALEDLQKQADAVSGIDAKLVAAQKEYFNMLCDFERTHLEVWNFFADFMVFAETLDAKPKADSYDSTEDYYTDLFIWYASVKEGYAAIECPPCMESEWKQLDNILDLNGSVVDKLYLASEYGDNLRYFAALNMADRYNTVVKLQAREILTDISSEAEFSIEQRNSAFDLAEEMHTYAGLGEEERDRYEFENIGAGVISLSYDAVDTIYPSLYNTYDAFLIIKTGCLSGSKKILVEAEIPGLTQTHKESFTLYSGYNTIYIKPPALTGELDLSSTKKAQINVTISEQDGTLIEAKTFPVTIKSKYDFEWYSDDYGVSTQDNILCFLTSDASGVSQLKRQAIEEISDMTGGGMESFVGYQEIYSNHYVNTYIQAAGIMRALYETGVRYNMDTFSISGSNQHILLPEDVLEQHSGLCIETSLVVASALQSAGMHAFLILPPGHAQVAVEVWNEKGKGAGQYFLIETTALENATNNRDIFVENANALFDNKSLNTSPITFMNRDKWLDYLSVDGTYIIDCDDSSVLGLTPFAN